MGLQASGEDADELKAAVEERIGAFLEETEEPEPEPEPELSPQQPANGDEDEVQAEVEGVANDGNDGNDGFDRLDVPAVPSDRADSGVSPSPGPGSPAVAPVTPDVPTDPDSGASGFCEATDEDDDEGKVPTRMIEEGNEEDDAEEEAPFDDADEAGDVAAPAGVDEDGGLEQALAEDISGIELTEHMCGNSDIVLAPFLVHFSALYHPTRRHVMYCTKSPRSCGADWCLQSDIVTNFTPAGPNGSRVAGSPPRSRTGCWTNSHGSATASAPTARPSHSRYGNVDVVSRVLLSSCAPCDVLYDGPMLVGC